MNLIIRKIKPGKHGVMGDGFGEKMPFVQRNASRKEQPQQGNSQCKGPGAGMCLPQASVAGLERGRRRDQLCLGHNEDLDLCGRCAGKGPAWSRGGR